MQKEMEEESISMEDGSAVNVLGLSNYQGNLAKEVEVSLHFKAVSNLVDRTPLRVTRQQKVEDYILLTVYCELSRRKHIHY